jgi:spoIIIJ-associated protein
VVEPKPATVQPAAEGTDDPIAVASAMLSELLRLMGVQATVRGHYASDGLRDKNEEPALVLDIVGNDLGILIGRRGETLTALQYVTRLMVNHKLERWVNVIVDVEEYKNRRERTLQQLAVRTAERVAATGRTLALEPMPARERRIIHLTLRDHPEVTTQSVGEGEHRKVTIVPKKA